MSTKEIQSNQCIKCLNYLGGRECYAFPKGIPAKIFTGEITHDHSVKGDDGIIFEPVFTDAEILKMKIEKQGFVNAE